MSTDTCVIGSPLLVCHSLDLKPLGSRDPIVVVDIVSGAVTSPIIRTLLSDITFFKYDIISVGFQSSPRQDLFCRVVV